jgi:hypothetical protein
VSSTFQVGISALARNYGNSGKRMPLAKHILLSPSTG